MLNYYSHQTIAVFWRATTYKSNLIKEKKTPHNKVKLCKHRHGNESKKLKELISTQLKTQYPVFSHCMNTSERILIKNIIQPLYITHLRTLMTESISVIKPWLYDLKACYYWITLKSTLQVMHIYQIGRFCSFVKHHYDRS